MLKPLLISCLLALAHAAPAHDLVAERATSPCYSGLYIISAKQTGDTSSDNIGWMRPVAAGVISRIPNSTVVGVPYPASKPPQEASVKQGHNTMTSMVESYVRSCNAQGMKAKIALLGYSQGAQVTLDVLCGTTELLFAKSAPLPTTYVPNIIASVVMGDPTHALAENPIFVYENGMPTEPKFNGVYKGKNVAMCKPYDASILSFCDNGDAYCSSTIPPQTNATKIHNTYISRYLNQAINFVVAEYNKKV